MTAWIPLNVMLSVSFCSLPVVVFVSSTVSSRVPIYKITKTSWEISLFEKLISHLNIPLDADWHVSGLKKVPLKTRLMLENRVKSKVLKQKASLLNRTDNFDIWEDNSKYVTCDVFARWKFEACRGSIAWFLPPRTLTREINKMLINESGAIRSGLGAR